MLFSRSAICCALVAAVAAARADGANVSALVAKLKSDSAEQRQAAAQQLGELGPKAIEAAPALIELLRDEDPGVFEAASKALGRMGPKAVPLLIEGLGSKQTNVCRGAALSLSLIGPQAAPAVKPLIAVVQEGRPEERLAALVALRDVGPAAKPAVPALLKATRADDFRTQYVACMVLEVIGPEAKAAVPRLGELLQSGSASVRMHAALALGGIGKQIGEPGVQDLVGALKDRSHIVRGAAATALGRLGDAARPAVPHLKAALDENRIDSRVAAVEALWKITGDADDVVARLTAEVAGEDEPEKAADLLAQFGPAAKPAIPKLIESLESENPFIRMNVASGLGRLGPLATDAIPALKKLKNDPNPFVRQAAEQAIERIEK